MTEDTLTAAPDRTPAGRDRIRFSARDLVNTAIFAVIYFVVVFAVAFLGVVSPLVMVLTLPLTPIVAGIPYLLFTTRVRHRGMLTLFGIVVALLFLVTGHPWQSTLLTILVSVLADAVLSRGAYRSKWAAIWAHTVFSIWFVGPWIPLFLDREGYLTRLGSYGAAYAQQFTDLVTVPTVTLMCVASVICGFLGGLLGSAILAKHFRKAGLA